jgi:hypothetical protein
MANRFIGGVLSSRPQANTPFVSRASTGTYFDSAGVMRTAPINQPRLNYNFVGNSWTQPAVLIEPASTNIVSYSEQFDDAFWTKGNATVTANSTTAPDGTTTADTLTENSSAGEHIVYCGFASEAAYYTLSVFAKAGTRSWISLYASGIWQSFNVSTGVVGTTGASVSATITPAGNGWYRCVVTRLMTATNNYWQLNIATGDNTSLSSPISYTGNGTGSVYIWGAQVEKTYGVSSYIPTTSAAVTRAADVVGPGTSGIYGLEDRQTATANDDQFKIESFTSTGSYSWTAPLDVASVEVLVVAGGGGGGNAQGGGGGGGAGGLLHNISYPVTPGTTYPIVVGAGGAGGATGATAAGTNGQNSQFGALIAIGGGAGSAEYVNGINGRTGGSGGGNCYSTATVGVPGIAGQGYSGSRSSSVDGSGYEAGGGGGGAGGIGTGGINTGTASTSIGGNGGPGLYFNISGTNTVYAGGGGGGTNVNASGVATGGSGIGGNGGRRSNTNGGNGAVNTGSGGGGGGTDSSSGGSGGSGIVIVKYKRTPRQISSVSNAAVVVQKFTTTNLWTVPVGVTSVEALVVAGGGSGGDTGGGGAGGLIYSSALAVTPGSTYTIGVGGGGRYGPYSGFGSGIGTGTELITNGSAFTTTTGWTATTATLSVPQTGTFRILPNASVNGTASQSITTVNGVTYVAVVKVTSDVAKQFRLYIGTTQGGNEITSFFTSYTNDSLDNGASGAGFYSTTFTATGSTTWINMQIGGGTQQATDISYISVRQTSTATFGGGVGGNSGTQATSGGSGGGGTYAGGALGGVGVAGQGNSGGKGGNYTSGHAGGGGGGAGGAGANAWINDPGPAGAGGPGLPFNFFGSPEYYAGGGGGGVNNNASDIAGVGGLGGGGAGGQTTVGRAGATNTGGGGGGGAYTSGFLGGGGGGSGVVILRYRVPQVATFLDSGSWTCPSGVTSVQALVVAGGGAGNQGFINAPSCGAGGGGGGGVVYSTSVAVTPGTTYSVVVGRGGEFLAGLQRTADSGSNSSFANIVAVGGGGGGMQSRSGGNGGSGGGGVQGGTVGGTGVYGQGYNGGIGNEYQFTDPVGCVGGGGGGAGGPGGTATGLGPGPELGGTGVRGLGGSGLVYSISGTSVTYSAGGNGSSTDTDAFPEAANTGNGGDSAGGGRSTPVDRRGTYRGGSGGSGIVIIRWVGA